MNQFSLMTCLLPGVSYFEDRDFPVHTMNIHTRCYPKVPEMYREKKSRNTQSPNRHRPLQSSPLGSVHNEPNVSATIGSCPGSPFMSACSVPSAIRPGSPLRCQIFALSTLAKKCCTAKAVCAGAFSWWSTQLSGRFRLMSSLSRLRTS
jgi:hypothetical protein